MRELTASRRPHDLVRISVGIGRGAAGRIQAALRPGRERHSTLQSDEGGRFLRSVRRYRIVELPATAIIDVAGSGYLWMGLGQINGLARIQGMFSNEARSALSMLLGKL